MSLASPRGPQAVGIAGLGRMGRAFCQRLVRLECDVSAWTRSQTEAPEGVRNFDAAETLARQCEIVIVSVSDDVAAREVHAELMKGATKGSLIIQTSTISPAVTVELAQEAEARSVDYVDAPVLGTTAPAREGKLVVLAGASPKALERARPLLSNLARIIHHVGPVGAGASTKLALNIPMTAYWAAMADALALVHAHGLDRAQFLSILADSPAALAQLPLKLRALLGESVEVGFDVNGLIKDLTVMQGAGREIGGLPIVDACLAAFKSAAGKGWAHADVAASALHRVSTAEVGAKA